MKENIELIQIIKDLLESQYFGILSSIQKDGSPYCNIIGFAAADNLESIIFATPRKSRKYINMMGEPRVSLLIDNRTNHENDFLDATAVTILGEAREADKTLERNMVEIYRKRHPQLGEFALSESSALMEVRVDTYCYVSRFQDVACLKIERNSRQ